jgi:hypothetical protein
VPPAVVVFEAVGAAAAQLKLDASSMLPVPL